MITLNQAKTGIIGIITKISKSNLGIKNEQIIFVLFLFLYLEFDYALKNRYGFVYLRNLYSSPAYYYILQIVNLILLLNVVYKISLVVPLKYKAYF
jgi:hypothetical protein